MRIHELASRPPGWINRSTPQEKVFLSGAVFKRNLINHFFVNNSSELDLLTIKRKVAIAIQDVLELKGDFFELDMVSEDEKALLSERKLYPASWVNRSFPSQAIFIGSNERFSILINGTEHIEIQSIVGGLALKKALSIAEKIERPLGELLEYAFAETMGYLTSDPLESGLGLHLFVVLHLPAIVITRQVNSLAELLEGVNVRLESVLPNNMGNLFVLTTMRQLGVTKREVYDSFAELIDMVLDLEDTARDMLLGKYSIQLEDRVNRALAVLQAAKTLSFYELSEYISSLKLGIALGILQNITVYQLDEILIMSQPAHIKLAFAESENFNEEVARAGFVRSKLGATHPIHGT